MALNQDFVSHLAGERPAFPLRPPAIVRHQVYRLRSLENPHWPSGSEITDPDGIVSLDDNTRSEEKWAAFCAELTSFVNSARSLFGTEGNIQLVRGPAKQGTHQHSINSTVFIQLTPNGNPLADHRPACRVRLRLDVHTETYAVTVSADQFDLQSKHPINQRLKALCLGANAPTEFYKEIWDQKNTPFGDVFSTSQSAHLRGAQFVDIRGIILPAGDVASTASDLNNEFDRSTGGYGDVKPLHPALKDYWNNRSALFNSILAESDPHQQADSVGSEAIACSMLDGRVLYAAPLVQWGAFPQPIRYLLVCAATSDDQVGRLVRRLHVLGELRHSALLDYDLGPGARDLKQASRALRLIGRLMDRTISAGELGVDRLLAVNKHLTELNEFADGGLVYRIEQSRYYAEAFRSRIQDLRIGRIEGFQPYDAFARRRIFQLFSKIDQIGRRYDALGRRVDRWTFLSDANSSSRFYDKIQQTTSEIQLVAQQIKNLQKTADEFLHNAEKFATVFLVYYVGYVLKEFVTDLKIVSIDERTFNQFWFFAIITVVMDVTGNEGKASKGVYLFVSSIGKLVFGAIGAAVRLLGTVWKRVLQAVLRPSKPRSDDG